MRRWALLISIAAAGCLPSADAPMPAVEGARAVFWVQASTGEAAVFAPDRALTLARPDDVVSLRYYPWPAESLGLSEGPLAHFEEPTQALPDPLAAFSGAPDADPPWRPTEVSALLPELRVPIPPLDSCLSRASVCVPSDAPVRCSEDCALPEVAPPAPAVMPCEGDGWTPLAIDDATVCRPPPTPELAACPIGTLRARPDAPCARPEACVDGPWPAAPPGPVRYVDPAAASGGDGSRERPYADLAAAAATAEDGATLLLTDGTYGAQLHLHNRALQIRGTCAGRSVIEGSLRASDGAELHLGALSVVTTTTALVVADAAVALSAVSLGGQGPLIEAVRADVQANLLRTDSGEGVAIDAAASTVRVVGWEHVGAGAAVVTDGAIEVSAATLAGTRGGEGLVVHGSATLRLSRARLEGFSRALEAYSGDLTLEDVAMVRNANGLQLRHTDERARRASADLIRVFTSSISGQGADFVDFDLVARQLVLHGGASGALQIAQSIDRRPTVRIEGLWARSRNSVIRLGGRTGGTGGQIEGLDWIAESEDRGGNIAPVLFLRNDVRLEATRLHLRGGVGTSLRSECADANLSDLVVIPSPSSGIVLHALRNTTLERVQIRGPTATAIDVGQIRATCDFGTTELSDVALLGCPTCVRGLRLSEGGRCVLRRSSVRRLQVGLEVETEGVLKLEDCEIADNDVGVLLPPEHGLDEVIRGVRFVGNAQHVQRR